MKISLAQSDIIAAVRAHVASQGFSLEGKTVQVDFSSTRAGKNGPMSVVANVSIENGVQLPDLSEDAAVTQRPQLAVVASNPVPAVAESPKAEPVAADEPQPEVAEAAPAAKTTSLFN